MNANKTINTYEFDANDVSIKSSAFYATFKMFRSYLGYQGPLSYELWNALPQESKAAGLFVQFFDTISLAWYKLKTPAAVEEDCVSEVIQYLIKNVSKIEDDEKRYSPKYIYKVAYNSIYCKSVDPFNGQTCETSWFTNNISPYIVSDNGDELSLFDIMMDNGEDSIVDSISQSDRARKAFWDKIYAKGPEYVAVASKLINEQHSETRPLAKLSEARIQEIIVELRVVLAEFVGIF